MARQLTAYTPSPLTTTLDHPIYAYGSPGTSSVALSSDALNYLKAQGHAYNSDYKKELEVSSGFYESNQGYQGYQSSSSRPDTLISPAIQSIYQNLNFVSVPPPTQSASLEVLEQPPTRYLTRDEVQGVLLRDKLKQHLHELQKFNDFGSIAVPVDSTFQVGSAGNYGLRPILSQSNPYVNSPLYHSQSVEQLADKFFYVPTTPSSHINPVSVDGDPYKYFERIQLTKGSLNKPVPLRQPVVQIGYPALLPNYHLSNSNSPNNFDTMTHSYNNKNRSEIQPTKTKTKLYINNNYITDINNSDGQSSVDPNWSSANGNGHSTGNKNNNTPNLQNVKITSEDENSNNNKSAKQKPKNNGPNGFESNSGDVNIIIKIDDNKNSESSVAGNGDKSSMEKAGSGGGNHGGSSHGNNNHGNNNHGNSNTMKKRRGTKRPHHEDVPNRFQTIFLQSMPTTTTTPAPPKTLEHSVASHDTHSKYSYLEKFLHVVPFLAILKPLSFGFWTLALSPLLVVAAGGVAIAVILYPWLTLSHEHQVAGHNRRPPPSVVIHRHRPSVIVRPRRKRPSHSIVWRERADAPTTAGPKSMQTSLKGVLQGKFVERQGIKKNLYRRQRRQAGGIREEFEEDYRDVEFRNWLMTKNNFQFNIMLRR